LALPWEQLQRAVAAGVGLMEARRNLDARDKLREAVDAYEKQRAHKVRACLVHPLPGVDR
jgi:hypothetical protein